MIKINTKVLVRPAGDSFEVEGVVTDIFSMNDITLYEVTFPNGNREMCDFSELIVASDYDQWCDQLAETRREYDDAIAELQHTHDGQPAHWEPSPWMKMEVA